jgi:hypothetical protein
MTNSACDGALKAETLQLGKYSLLIGWYGGFQSSLRSVTEPDVVQKPIHSTTWYMQHHKGSPALSQYFFL